LEWIVPNPQDPLFYVFFLLQGALVTLELTAASLIVVMISSFTLAVLRMSPHRAQRYFAGFIVETFRGTSALVQLFWMYYIFPLFGLNVPPFWAAIIVLGLNSGSYLSEIIRSSFMSVSLGQREAATALHLPKLYVFRHILLPQALPVLLPGFGNMLVSLLKLTSLASLVTIQELSFRASQLRTNFGETGPTYAATLFIYFLLALILGRGVKIWERKAARAAGREIGQASGSQRKSAVPDWALAR
jgi:polar amino acid transport system permease protein